MRCLEAGEPLGVGDGKEQVIVIGHEDKGLDVDKV